MSAWEQEDSPGDVRRAPGADGCTARTARALEPPLRNPGRHGGRVDVDRGLRSGGLGDNGPARGIALAAFVAMALWIRGNRAAFDYADWCECAAEKITVRVIPSQRPEPERPPL